MNTIFTIMILLMILTNAQQPYSLSYTKYFCKAVALTTAWPQCYCVAECRNYSSEYPNVPVYKINPSCKLSLYENGGYSCMCPESGSHPCDIMGRYQFFD